MATLTKEQLKNELISHGVQPPVQSARKEEFVKLYEQHVAPIVAQKGDFSSDEETEPNSENKVEASNNSLIFNGLDITTISDEELFSQLQSFGIPVGPIVDTTRSVYQRKLAALLHNGVPAPVEETDHTNGNGAPHEEKFSDSEEEEEQIQQVNDIEIQPEAEPEPPVKPSAPIPDPVISTPEPLTAIRKRMTERPPSSLNALPLVDRQGTPTPRPSIHSLTGSSSQYTYESRRLLDTTDSSKVKPLPSQLGSSPNKAKIVRYVLLVLVLLATAYVVYTFASVSQIKQLAESIRQKSFQYLEKAEQIAEKMDNAKPNPTPDV